MKSVPGSGPEGIPTVAPTRSDPAMAAGAEILGGPAGSHSAGGGLWTPLRIIVIVGSAVFWLGFLRTYPCISNGWLDPDRYEALCYSDIPVLYSLRGLADGMVPYLEWPTSGHPLEYPVLIGGLLWVLAAVTRLLTGGAPDATVFYVVNAIALFAFFLTALVATALTVRGRVWDGLMLAAAPAMLLASLVNWDWPAVALTALFLLAWSRRHPAWAGIALGLAVAAKFYPLLLLGPLFLLCLRGWRLRDFAITLAATIAAWLAVNVPVMVKGFDGWSYFFTFSAERGQDFGSLWLALQTAGFGVSAEVLNNVATAAFLILCAALGALILLAPRRPRIAQVSFLVVAAFLVTNKVYSPQFVLWLLPLAILARPRWRDVIWWQLAEAVYFVSVWWYLVGLSGENKGLPEQWYAAAIMVHIGATMLFAGLVVRDIVWPSHDPVRSDGVPEHSDDPGGGVLDGVPDWGRPPTPAYPPAAVPAAGSVAKP